MGTSWTPPPPSPPAGPRRRLRTPAPLRHTPDRMDSIPGMLLPLDTYDAARRLEAYAAGRGGWVARDTHVHLEPVHTDVDSVVVAYRRVPTLVFYPPDTTVYGTPAAPYLPRGMVRVHLEGWFTGMSMSRVNSLLPARVLRLAPSYGELVGMWQWRPDVGQDVFLRLFVEGAAFDLETAALLDPPYDAVRTATETADLLERNERAGKLISHVLHGLTDAELNQLAGMVPSCPVCAAALERASDPETAEVGLAPWPRAHLLAHLRDDGRPSAEFAVYALDAPWPAGEPSRKLSDGSMVYTGGNLAVTTPRQRLRAHLRDQVWLGPLTTYYGRRWPLDESGWDAPDTDYASADADADWDGGEGEGAPDGD